ncbi:tryptophan synthase beta subunit-like PLP-dependent enzyme [Xylariomycetidae sp. FL2044]|nr:tryptophan synthase beta subunit-like PLP-dependent enzyme [Xylariomycetidae sp. FL2044]
MSDHTNLNVYKGADAVRDYFNPGLGPPLPLIELPATLNPYRIHGVHIYAKMMTMHPANNVKAMPALALLENTVIPGQTDTVIEYSSGSTVISMSLISQVYYGISNVCAFLSNKTSRAKLRLMQFFGLNITLFGGPSQPEPTDRRGGIAVAKEMAEGSANIVNPNQYDNDSNWRSHIQWTGPQIMKQLPEITVICAGMGTSGTMTGLGTYFKGVKPSVFRLGVCTAAGDRVPGPRSLGLLSPVQFPWREAVDHIEEVGSHDSYSLSLSMCRNGIICGPSSGFSLQGLYKLLDKHLGANLLCSLAGDDGEVHCVFLCCDLPYQYIDEYFDKLGPEHFPVIKNEELTTVDLFRYDEAWEVKTKEAIKHVPVILDLRQPEDFDYCTLSSSVNRPFTEKGTTSPFKDPKKLFSLWKKLEAYFQNPDEEVDQLIGGKPVLLVCYDGDTSRVASSVFRAKGFEAYSLKGGFKLY